MCPCVIHVSSRKTNMIESCGPRLNHVGLVVFANLMGLSGASRTTQNRATETNFETTIPQSTPLLCCVRSDHTTERTPRRLTNTNRPDFARRPETICDDLGSNLHQEPTVNNLRGDISQQKNCGNEGASEGRQRRSELLTAGSPSFT